MQNRLTGNGMEFELKRSLVGAKDGNMGCGLPSGGGELVCRGPEGKLMWISVGPVDWYHRPPMGVGQRYFNSILTTTGLEA